MGWGGGGKRCGVVWDVLGDGWRSSVCVWRGEIVVVVAVVAVVVGQGQGQ